MYGTADIELKDKFNNVILLEFYKIIYPKTNSWLHNFYSPFRNMNYIYLREAIFKNKID